MKLKGFIGITSCEHYRKGINPDCKDESVTETGVRDALGNIVPIWKGLFLAEQQPILALMIAKVIVNYELVNIRIRDSGMESLAPELDEQDKRLQRISTKNERNKH